MSLISSSPVTVFSATYCRYCGIAKKTLDGIGTSYTAVELDKMDPGEGGQLAMGLREVTGEATVPQASLVQVDAIRGLFPTGGGRTRGISAKNFRKVIRKQHYISRLGESTCTYIYLSSNPY